MLYSFLRWIVGICILLALLPLKIFAQHQDISFRHLTLNEGLGNNNVFSICKDFRGYMWFGTENGLNKFDGYDFKIYRKEEKNPSTLFHNYCWTIYEDKSHNLWVGTRGGLNLYNREADSFIRLYIDSAQKYNSVEYSVRCIYEDSHNRLWVGTSKGLYQFDRSTKKFKKCLQQLKDKYNFTAIVFKSITEDKDSNLWIGTSQSENGGLIQVRDEKVLNIYQHNPSDATSLSNNNIYFLFADSKNNLWISTKGGCLDKLNKNSGTFTHYSSIHSDLNLQSTDYINMMDEDSEGNLWLGSANGLIIFNPAKNTTSRVMNNPNDNRTLLSNNLAAIYIDELGIVWIGSRFGGIDIFEKQFNTFKHYKYIPESNNSLSFNNVSSFAEDRNGNIWIATDGGGLNYFNPVTKKFIGYNINNKEIGLPNNKTVSLLIDRDNILWVGVWLGGIVKFRIEGSRLIPIDKYPLLNPENKNSNTICSIYQTSNNDIFVSSHIEGLYKYNKNLNTFNLFPLVAKADSQRYPITDCINEDHNGNIWIGSEDRGLFVVEHSSGKVKNYIYNEYGVNCISSTSIFCIHEDKKNRMWFGTDNGLNLFDPFKGTFKVYKEKDGLPSNYICGILEDNNGNLWISTIKGLSKSTIKEENGIVSLDCKNYDISEGLQGLQYNHWAYLKSSKGLMYFGGNNGFNSFCPDSIKISNYVPPVYITGLSLFNKPVLPGPGSPLKKWISETDEIKLASKQKVITLQFVAIDFIDPSKNNYKYKLEGFDKDWNFIGHKREVTYTNLPAGNYTFKVIASNNDGPWITKGATLNLVITPPFWNTLWFKTIILIVLIGLLIGFYLYKTVQIRKRSELMERLVRQRTFEVNSQKEEIEKINILLIEQKNELEAQTEELQSQAEELYNHSEALEHSNKEIQNQRDDLKKAYEELNKYRDQLEDLVIERTRDLNAAKEKAEESDNLKSAFLANMSHEIRTPLNAIIGFAKLLTSSNFSDKEKVDFSLIVEQNSNYLLSLVDDILDISKIESGIIKLNFIPVVVNQVLNDIDFIYNEEVKKLEKHNISILFKTNLPAEILKLEIITDPVRLRQIITNLINNALKYTKAGYVEFGVQFTADNMLQFYVKDTGIGIKKEYTDLIFDRFRKFEDSTTEIYRGTGLGLAIVKQLVELMNGEIWVESEFGIGSTFYFNLPSKKA